MSKTIGRRQFIAYSAGAATLGSFAATDDALARWNSPRRRRRIDVSCNANSIRFVGPQGANPNDPNDPGPHPYYGASFVVLGTIYPGGTFRKFGNSSGLTAEGFPEFPDRVIGGWICRGWFVGDSDGDGVISPKDDDRRGGIFTPAGRFVVTTQVYDLNPHDSGSQTLISDGIERIEVGVPFTRAVTGGSGRFRSAKGQVSQTAVGANATTLFNFEFDFNLYPRALLY